MYHYETLGDERFQALCQALISAIFPDAQCLPAGQPDGGRDAFLVQQLAEGRRSGLSKRSAETELIVFQVKYIKNPADSRTERQFIEEIAKKERNKIIRLRKSGIGKYYLITNLRGTAHPDSGSIDKVNAQLSMATGISNAYCWWRDDIDRRLDNNSGIKWSYPEILKATDLLEKLISGQLGEEEERRKGAIRAYMTAQYEDDRELKFKQTELRSNMTELFVDLPMSDSPDPVGEDETQIGDSRYAQQFVLRHARQRASALHFLTHQQQKLDRIVLEGAPGQGKSTVTQYICQVMRLHLLGKQSEIDQLPQQHRNIRVRVPFRVDLRDLAKWISGVDPFQPKQVELDAREPRSLEGFLAGQVRHASGGHSFNVSDLDAVARATHLFLALDGFDEVVDVVLRQRLVDEISKGAGRLINAGGFSMQTIVTSRPAAFAKSVRFPRNIWTYFQLIPLDRVQVDEYAKKWMKAKGLKELECADLRRILDIKLGESHIQYLAKNPMQLTILLSLIHIRGASLPDKRTALYDTYMEMFFSRESEKSDVVRDNRDLLIDIHRYLAWKLHTAAEAGENGSIEQSALRTILFSYLDREGEDTGIVGTLFSGIIERVGALVSRVQDTYEFEVQPLREYFAARHLYDTAPPATTGEAGGDKFDRFKALIRNPYWLNVARFYGGCFNKGELLTLLTELIGFDKSEHYKSTSHSRSLCLMFLWDWVFAQYQPAVKMAIAFITEHPWIRQLLASAEGPEGADWAVLPERSGRSEFLNTLWVSAVECANEDEMAATAHVIAQNSPAEDRWNRWMSVASSMPHRRWTLLGAALRLFGRAQPLRLGDSAEKDDELVERLIERRRFDILEDRKWFDSARAAILDRVVASESIFDRQISGRLEWLATLCGCHQYVVALTEDSRTPLRHSLRRYGWERRREATTPSKLRDFPKLEKQAVDEYMKFIETATSVTSTSITPWSDLVKAMRAAWGDCAAIDRIAFVGAGVRSLQIDAEDVRLKDAVDLVSAARFARLKSGAPRWWVERLDKADKKERERLLLLVLMWATPRTLVKLAKTLAPFLAELNADEWCKLCNNANYILPALRKQTRDQQTEIDAGGIASIMKFGSRVSTFIGRRLGRTSQYGIAVRLAGEVVPPFSSEGQFALETIFFACSDDQNKWADALPCIKRLYAIGCASLPYVHDIRMPEDIAKQISRDVDCFPLPIVAIADDHLRSIAGTQAPKLLEVARRDRWFNDV